MRRQPAGAMLPAMHRTTLPSQPRRPLGAWLLLWLLVALLPLRPVASWAMVAGSAPAPAAAHADASPCHGHAAMAEPDAGADAAADTVATQQSAPCSACDLCHAAMAGPAMAGLGALPVPRAAPTPLALVAARPAPADGVFRPPRA